MKRNQNEILKYKKYVNVKIYRKFQSYSRLYSVFLNNHLKNGSLKKTSSKTLNTTFFKKVSFNESILSFLNSHKVSIEKLLKEKISDKKNCDFFSFKMSIFLSIKYFDNEDLFFLKLLTNRSLLISYLFFYDLSLIIDYFFIYY